MNPRIDIVFKKIFGVEANKHILISLINSIVSPEDQVKDVTILNPYNLQTYISGKLSILDIKAKASNGHLINIEIQITDDSDYDKRALYYWSRLYSEQLGKSENYSTLSKAIGIHILNFTSIPEVTKYHNIFQITEKESKKHYFKDLELHTIELKKFADEAKDELSDFVQKIKTSIDLWSTFLLKNDFIKKLPQKLVTTEVEDAMNALEIMHFTEEEKEFYEGQLKWFRIEISTIKKAKDDSFLEGKIKGKAEGIKEGEEKGKIETAKNLLALGVSIDIIIKATGLTKEEIDKIKL